MKKFAFLFPDSIHFGNEISNGAYGWKCSPWKKRWNSILDSSSSEEEREILKEKALLEKGMRYIPKFFRVFNKSVEERYRKKDFQINWIVLDNEPISPYVKVLMSDRIISSGVNFILTEKKEKTLSGYPNFNSLVSKIGYCEHLRVGGHLAFDCVDKLAEEAHKNCLDVLVDEDLTDFFQSHISEPSFRTESYPSINFRKLYAQRGFPFEEFLEPRKGKPWFYQDY